MTVLTQGKGGVSGRTDARWDPRLPTTEKKPDHSSRPREPWPSLILTSSCPVGGHDWNRLASEIKFQVIASCIRTKLTHLNSVGPVPADGQYNRHPGRGTTADHPPASISPESNRSRALVESSRVESDSSVSSSRRSQMEVPPHARCPSKDPGKRGWPRECVK
jgi:hypothetical protein